MKKKVEVLITTMNMKSHIELLSRMNINTNAKIGNQTDKDEVVHTSFNNNDISIYSFKEKGVGLNRNNLLMRTKADYCLFGDDDLIYCDNYQKIVTNSFDRFPDADVIIFNLEDEKNEHFITTNDFRVKYTNFMRFGAARIAVKVNSISMNNIYFNLNFGGGCQFSNGEDTLFLYECLRKKLKIYAVNDTIAKLTHERESTWFSNYNEKYFEDKFILYYTMSKKIYKLLFLQDVIRHRKLYNCSPIKLFNKMNNKITRYIEENK